MGIVYTGLDAGSRVCHVVAMNKEAIVLKDEQFDTSEKNLIDTIGSIKGNVHLNLEASELAGWIYRIMKPRVAEVFVSHAKTNAWIAKDPLKRDRVDAFKLADLLRMGRVHEVYYTDDSDRLALKQLVQHYDDITRDEARQKVKIKARLRAQGYLSQGTRLFHPTGREEILQRLPTPQAKLAIGQIYTLLDNTLTIQRQARNLLKTFGKDYPEIARLDSVPGVGLIGACRFVGYVMTPERFANKRKLWRYCRLGITDRSSDGRPLGRKRLDRNGNGCLKNMARVAFQGAMKTKIDNMFKRAYQRTLAHTHNPVHARLSTQRKILTVLWTLWKTGVSYDDMRG